MASTGGTIIGTPNAIDINQPLDPMRNRTNRMLTMTATIRRCSRQLVKRRMVAKMIEHRDVVTETLTATQRSFVVVVYGQGMLTALNRVDAVPSGNWNA
jgi:hypothetical protein